MYETPKLASGEGDGGLTGRRQRIDFVQETFFIGSLPDGFVQPCPSTAFLLQGSGPLVPLRQAIARRVYRCAGKRPVIVQEKELGVA